MSTIIPAMDHIDTYLATANQNLTYSPSICAALMIGKTTLNQYYNKTNYSEVYRIVMGTGTFYLIRPPALLIFPQFSTPVTSSSISRWPDGMTPGSKPQSQLFMMSLIIHMHLWTLRKWIQQLRYESNWICYFYKLTTQHDLQPPSSSFTNIFDDLPALSTPATSELHDELDCYLSTDSEQVTNVCKWWYERKGTYPCLYHMALDYLTNLGVYLKSCLWTTGPPY